MSDVGGEIAENCGFEGKILCEVPQSCDTPATEYTPPEGWRVLAVGEVLREGDVWVTKEGESRPTKRVGERVNDELYIRCDPIEPQPESQPEPVQVGEGRWRTRAGDICNVTPTPEGNGREHSYPWWDAQCRQTWTSDGRYYLGEEDQRDLVEYVGPLNPEPVPQAAAIEELRSEVSYVQRLLDESRQRVTHLEELVTSLRNSNKAQEKAFTAVGKANTDLQHRLNVVSAEWSEQAETIRGLQARIFDLETINQAMEKAVNDAGKTNNKLRTQAEEFRFEISYLQNLLGEARAEQADRLAQLEVLQPIAAACHTAQTMVRDMLGHMRCLLALHHTTDRSNFCALLESILEVFDDAKCDEGEDEDTTCTTNTSEAGQG